MMGTVFGIGEVLWDLLPSGPQLGGAPTNFAFHVAGLGIPAGVVTRVGQDAYGEAIRTRFSEMRLPAALIQADSTLPTGTVSVTLSPAGVPDYTIHEPAAWDRLAATPEALSAMETAAAVCFGSLAQRSSEARQAIQRLVTATPRAAWRIFDVNLRQCYYDRAVVQASLELANVVKLNEDEVPLVTDLTA
jgi:fructokinase